MKKGTISEDDRSAALGRIRPATELSGIAEADLVVEAATENRDLKFSIFQEMDRQAR